MEPVRGRGVTPPIDDLAALGLLEDEAIVLYGAALRLAALDHQSLPLDPYVDLLTRITERLVATGRDADGAADQADALARTFAEDYGFEGDRDSYDHPDNADLIRVIDRRRGLPISLAILYVSAARRLAWPATVLNTPGHVLVRIGGETDSLLVDPFNRGMTVDAEQLAQLLAASLGQRTRPIADHLAPLGNRATLVRLLQNQASRAEAAGSATRALTVFRRMTTVAPGHGQGWWDRARLELAAGAPGDARASLSAMLEVTRDPAIRDHVFAALDALAASRG